MKVILPVSVLFIFISNKAHRFPVRIEMYIFEASVIYRFVNFNAKLKAIFFLFNQTWINICDVKIERK